ncbi:MAG: hypothetical protein ACE5G2_04225, partial [Candidatus Krumholzibacteriia bacterium]
MAAGGFFTESGGRPVNRIARWDGTTWSPIGDWTDDTVYSLFVHDGKLIAGSVVWRPDWGTWEDMIVHWDGTSWIPMGAGPLGHPFPNALRALASFGGSLIAGGQFPRADGTIVNYIARWDGSAWVPVGSGMNNPVYAVAVFGGSLHAGGEFTEAGGSPAQGIARWDGATWNALEAVQPGLGMNGTVWALFEHADKLVAGGEFTLAGRAPANRVAAFDGSSWTALGSGMSGRVFTFVEFAGDLVAGGEFVYAGGIPVLFVARWDGSAWHALGNGVGGPVRALVVHEGRLIVGGDFDSAGGMPAHKIASWDGSSWQPMGDGFSGGFADLGVRSLEVFRGELHAGGHFTRSGHKRVDFVARWTGHAWGSVGKGLPATGYALIARDRDLFAGSVVWVEGTGTWEDIILRWPGGWKPLGSGMLDPPFPNAGRAFTFRGGRLIAGGQFPRAGGSVVNYVAKWAGESWRPFGSGTNAPVYAVANYQGSLFVGGEFTAAGNKPAFRIARWDGPPDNAFEAMDFQTETMEDHVRLTWNLTEDVVSELAEVRVQRKSNGGFYAEVTGAPLVPGISMSFDDLAADARVTYWYRLVLVPLQGER